MISRRHLLAAGLALPAVACVPKPQGPPASVPTSAYHGTYLEQGPTLPGVTLTDTLGKPFNLARDVKTPAVMLFFGYTNCPDVCPGIMADMATARRRMPPELAKDVTLVVITTDPPRDTPQVLGDYLRRVDEDFVGLSGDISDILKAGSTLGISITDGKKLPSGGYEVDHSTQVLGFHKGQLRLIWSEPSVQSMRDDVTRLLGHTS